jgi:hypothetical protein
MEIFLVDTSLLHSLHACYIGRDFKSSSKGLNENKQHHTATSFLPQSPNCGPCSRIFSFRTTEPKDTTRQDLTSALLDFKPVTTDFTFNTHHVPRYTLRQHTSRAHGVAESTTLIEREDIIGREEKNTLQLAQHGCQSGARGHTFAGYVDNWRVFAHERGIRKADKTADANTRSAAEQQLSAAAEQDFVSAIPA